MFRVKWITMKTGQTGRTPTLREEIKKETTINRDYCFVINI